MLPPPLSLARIPSFFEALGSCATLYSNVTTKHERELLDAKKRLAEVRGVDFLSQHVALHLKGYFTALSSCIWLHSHAQ